MTVRNGNEVALMGLGFASLTAAQTCDRIFASLDGGEGGLLLTANLEILRQFVHEPEWRQYYEAATFVVADGMPIVWASHVHGTPLPERVAGSSLVPTLAARAARENRSIYMLGGEGDDAPNAMEALARATPGLRIVGVSSPRVSLPPTEDEVASLVETLAPLAPDLMLIAMGSPKQDALAIALRPHLPSTWFVGVGASFAFIGGRVPRAPAVMQRLGLEWLHRVATEPKRLARRYLVEGLPFAAELMLHARKTRIARP